ncbi:PH domain-containing protein [Bacillus kexueae]|uniref:PH domain-containing protein n=1 Tax=Aeribacillus kexueae TaxID=2078952 RepID=UPI001FB00518|nr:PH domain-containing protein [Bacillus kexueae]
MYEARRLHPVAGIVKLVKLLRNLIATFLILFVGMPVEYKIYSYIGMAVIIFVILLYSFIYWIHYTYRVEEDEFRLDYGWIFKKKRYIPLERIQTVHVSAGLIQQLFGLVKLQIETAGGGEQAEIELSAIKKEDAVELQEWLRMNKHQEVVEKERDQTIYRMTTKQLLMTAATSSGFGVILSILAFLSQFDELLTNEFFSSIETRVKEILEGGIVTILLTVTFLLVVAWGISVLGVLLKYAHFRVVLKEDELTISKGVIEKRTFTVPLERIQAVRIVENPVRQAFGFATVYIETASTGNGEGDEGGILFPLISKKELIKKLEEYLLIRVPETLNPLPKRALPRFSIVNVMLTLIVAVPLSMIFAPWGLLALLLVPVSLFISYYQYRDGGWLIDGNRLTLSFRHISKVVVLMEKRRIQSLDVQSTYFQRRKNLLTISSSIMNGFSGRLYSVRHLEEKDGMEIYDWYSRS